MTIHFFIPCFADLVSHRVRSLEPESVRTYEENTFILVQLAICNFPKIVILQPSSKESCNYLTQVIVTNGTCERTYMDIYIFSKMMMIRYLLSSWGFSNYATTQSRYQRHFICIALNSKLYKIMTYAIIVQAFKRDFYINNQNNRKWKLLLPRKHIVCNAHCDFRLITNTLHFQLKCIYVLIITGIGV